MNGTDYISDTEENFSLSYQPEVEQFTMDFTEPTDLNLEFADIVPGQAGDFNALYNRPSYDGAKMTGDTNIPKIIVDSKLSSTSTNPVENRVIYANINEKANANDLAPVAFSGEYEDLVGEPDNFTDSEWRTLWAKY